MVGGPGDSSGHKCVSHSSPLAVLRLAFRCPRSLPLWVSIPGGGSPPTSHPKEGSNVGQIPAGGLAPLLLLAQVLASRSPQPDLRPAPPALGTLGARTGKTGGPVPLAALLCCPPAGDLAPHPQSTVLSWYRWTGGAAPQQGCHGRCTGSVGCGEGAGCRHLGSSLPFSLLFPSWLV